jgi:hypothetical protein
MGLVERRVQEFENKPLKRIRTKGPLPPRPSEPSPEAPTSTTPTAPEASATAPETTTTADIDFNESDECEIEVHFSDLIGEGTQVPHYDVLLTKGRKEITEKLRPDLIEEIVRAKLTEWQTVDAEKHAVRVLSSKESNDVKRQRPDRLIDTRFVLTIKIGENGQEMVKARWVARGFKDPDALKLVYRRETSAPTVSQNARTLALQVMASMKWKIQIGDIRGAFMEADRLERPEGPLYARQPPGGLPGLHPDQIVELVLPLYGLDDAPCRWFNKISGWLQSTEGNKQRWEQSRLDPCLFFLRSGGELVGVLVIHVDGVLIGGTGEVFETALRELRAAFPFRKWATGGGEYCGTVLTQDEITFDIKCTQDKAYDEVRPVSLRRRARDDEPATDAEVAALQRLLGQGGWICSQTRVDACVQVSQGQQTLPKPTVGQVRRVNALARRLRQHSDMSIMIRSIRSRTSA